MELNNENKIGSPYRWRVLVSTSIAYFYDSYALIILAIALPNIIGILKITLAQGGLLSSASMIGAAVGSIIFGLVAENRGKKFTLVLSLAWFGIGTAGIFIVNTWGQWMILRFVTCLGVGGVFGPAVALISAHWKAEYRARATSFVLSTFAIGAVFAAFLGRWVLSTDWRILFIVGTTAIAAAVICQLFIPTDIVDKKEKAVKSDKIGIGALFTPGIMRITILALLFNITNMGAYWGFATWVPTFLKTDGGLSSAQMTNFSVFMYIGMFIGYQVWSTIADKIGRRRVLITVFILNALGILLYLIVKNSMFLFWWGMVVGFSMGGVSGVQGAYFGELFPENIRALGSGFCFNVGRIGSVLAPFTVGAVADNFGLRAGLMVVPAIYLLGVLFVSLLPETFKKKEKMQ